MIAVVRGAVHAAVALALGAGAAAVVGLNLDSYRASRAPEGVPEMVATPRDRIIEATAELNRDGVHVPPDGRGLITEEGERAVEQAVAAAEVPVYVIVWPVDQQLGAYSLDVTDQVAAGLDADRGTLLIWSGPEQGDAEQFGGRSFGSVYAQDFVGDPGTTLPRLVAQVSDPDDWYEREEFDYWGGTGGGIAAAFLIVSAILLGLGVPNGIARIALGRWPIPGRWRWTEETR